MSIEVGDIVKYLGISYRVTYVDDLLVKLRRANGGVIDMEVLRGSNRFNAIFSRRENSLDLMSSKRINDKKEESRVEDAKGFDENTDIFKFILKYSKRDSSFKSDDDAMEELKRDLLNNSFFYFIAYSYFRRNSVFKFNHLDRIASAFESYKEIRSNAPSMCDSSADRLLSFYRASLNDESEVSEEEIRSLAKVIPSGADSYNLLSCFCGWESLIKKVGGWVFTTKKLSRVITEVDSAKEAEDL